MQYWGLLLRISSAHAIHGMARVTSCLSLYKCLIIYLILSFKCAHRVETQQNIELMTFAVTWSVNIFVGCSVTPNCFFGRSLPFLILSIILKDKKNLCVGRFNYFSYTIQIGSNWYMDTGVRDLEVAFFKAKSTWINDICNKDLSNRPIYALMILQLE